MLLAQGLGGPQWVLLGSSILILAFVLRRGAVRARQSQSRDLPADVRQQLLAAEKAVASTIHGLEARLYDYGREIDAKAQTRIAQLDQLVLDAERLIGRLDDLLAAARQHQQDVRSTRERGTADVAGCTAAEMMAMADILCGDALSIDERTIVAHLLQSGYRPEQVAKLFHRSPPPDRGTKAA
jgi:hypothetical protein